MEFKLLVINPGSTSTKISIFVNEKELFEKSRFHDAPVLLQFSHVNGQVPFRYQVILDMLKEEGVEVLAVEQAEGSTMLQDFKPETSRRYAIVLGNEVKGVHQEVIDLCDGCLEIPQRGTKHSMNVSVAAGIVIYHFVWGR